MDKILAALHLDDPASLKRAITTALSAIALLAVNPLLTSHGMPPVDDAVLASVAGLVATFVLQSGLKSAAVAKQAGMDAAAKVDSVEKAAGVLAEAPKP